MLSPMSKGEPGTRRRLPIRRDTLREDAVAGLVLGVQSVPDGLATGLLAGVNPLSGLYGYMVGTITGALVTSSSFMAIQGTGRHGDDRGRRPRGARCRRPGARPVHALGADRRRHAGGRPPEARVDPAVRVERRDGRVHQRRRRQHHPRPARQLHRLRRGGCQPDRAGLRHPGQSRRSSTRRPWRSAWRRSR